MGKYIAIPYIHNLSFKFYPPFQKPVRCHLANVTPFPSPNTYPNTVDFHFFFECLIVLPDQMQAVEVPYTIYMHHF